MPNTRAPLALGIDCGFSRTGLAVVRGPVEAPKMLYGMCIRSKADKNKDVRRSHDDTRRLNIISAGIESAIVEFAPDCGGVEFYLPYPGRGSGSWKVAMCYGLTVGICKSHRIPVFAQLPIDVKFGVTGTKTSSKGTILRGIEAAMPSLRPFLDAYAPLYHEHIADAAGHALLALRSHLNGETPHL